MESHLWAPSSCLGRRIQVRKRSVRCERASRDSHSDRKHKNETKRNKKNWKNTLTWQQQIRHFLFLYSNVPLLSCSFVIWLEHKMHLFALLLQNTFSSGEDNGDASVYEMMCTAGEWGTDGKWKEDKGKPVMELFCCCVFFPSPGTSLRRVAVHFRPLNIFPSLMGTPCSVASD